MANEFLVDFDNLLNQILVDYQNLDSNPDTSVGTMTYIKGACLASMLWGLYRYQDYLARQIFPDSADTENLNRHGNVLGIPRSSVDTDSTYLAKILNKLRKPGAGGNRNDWKQWTMYDEGDNRITTGPGCYVSGGSQTGGTLDVDNMLTSVSSIQEDQTFYIEGDSQLYTLSTQANFVSGSATLEFTPDILVAPDNNAVVRFVGDDYYVSNATVVTPSDLTTINPGDVDLVIVPNDETILETATMDALKNIVEANVEELRPVTANGYTVNVVEIIDQVVSINNVSGVTATDITSIQEDIIAYGESLSPGDKFIKSKLVALCFDNGATSATVSTPTSDVTPTLYQAVRVSGTPSVVTV